MTIDSHVRHPVQVSEPYNTARETTAADHDTLDINPALTEAIAPEGDSPE